MKIPTLRSPEDAAGGARMGWLWVSHWCAGCEPGRSSSCYSTGDERVGILWKEGCACVCVFIPARSRHVFSDESGASESSGGLTDMWWNVVGVCVLKCAFTPWPSELLLFSGIENEKFGKKRGSKETEEFISTKKHHSRTTSTLHVFRAVTQTACSGKMFHWNLMGYLLLWALTCVCLCVCVCLAGAHQTHAGVSLAEV